MPEITEDPVAVCLKSPSTSIAMVIQAAIDNIVPTRLRPLRPRANRTNSTELGTQFLYIIHDENLLYDVPTSY